VGDQKNDIPMFDITPHSVTLLSSLPSVKKAAKHIIDAKPSFVVQEAINRYIK
jgi:hydroxymethylpyrimidine pyrophosphatase-like HAD family hydrolase